MSTPYDLLFEMEKRAQWLGERQVSIYPADECVSEAFYAEFGSAAENLRSLVRFARSVLSMRDDLRHFIPNPAPNTTAHVVLDRLDAAEAALRREESRSIARYGTRSSAGPHPT